MIEYLGKQTLDLILWLFHLFSFDDRVCVSDQMIFIQNVPFTTKNTGDGLFCIYHNNSKCVCGY